MKFSTRRWAASVAVALASTIVSTGAHATTVTRQPGLLGTFSGSPDSPDLDALSATAVYDDTNIYLSSTMAGPIGLTAQKAQGSETPHQGVYVWGVDRGSGTDVLNGPTKLPTDTSTPIGAGVAFDAFIVMQDLADGHGDGFIALIGRDGALAGVTALAADAISYSGNTINLVVPISMLPSQPLDPNGVFDIASYGYNMWPRLDGISSNLLVADFLPNNTDFTASAVPEPASWALMIAGFGLAGGVVRARRRGRALMA